MNAFLIFAALYLWWLFRPITRPIHQKPLATSRDAGTWVHGAWQQSEAVRAGEMFLVVVDADGRSHFERVNS